MGPANDDLAHRVGRQQVARFIHDFYVGTAWQTDGAGFALAGRERIGGHLVRGLGHPIGFDQRRSVTKIATGLSPLTGQGGLHSVGQETAEPTLDPARNAAAQLLILTGCRLSGIMTLRLEHVDIPGKALRLPDSKTGAKVVHLGQPAIDVLENIKRLEDNP